MKVRNYTAVCLKCSHCGNIEKIKLNLFDFSGDDEKLIRCSKCDRVICKVDVDIHKKYKLEISCAECGSRHKFSIPISEFWHTNEKSFCCSFTEGIILAVGDYDCIEKVFNENLCFEDDDFEDDDKDAGFDSKSGAENIYNMISKDKAAFMDSDEFFECLEHFKFLSEENLIVCDCKGNAIQLQIEEDGFRLICSRCGREIFFDFSSREKIDKIMMLSEIRLH